MSTSASDSAEISVKNLPIIELTRVFDAPRELVFSLWTDPKHLAEWWGPHEFTNPRCEWDARPGGKIHVDMRGPDGTVYPMTGEFLEVVPPERLVFVAAALGADGRPMIEDHNEIIFTERNGETTVSVRSRVTLVTPEGAPGVAGMEEGWSQSLDRLQQLAESASAQT
jgi:uncharacterized protein YndB with AHSA1/START domain